MKVVESEEESSRRRFGVEQGKSQNLERESGRNPT